MGGRGSSSKAGRSAKKNDYRRKPKVEERGAIEVRYDDGTFARFVHDASGVYDEEAQGAFFAPTPIEGINSLNELYDRIKNNPQITIKVLSEKEFNLMEDQIYKLRANRPDPETGTGFKDNREYRKMARQQKLSDRTARGRYSW